MATLAEQILKAGGYEMPVSGNPYFGTMGMEPEAGNYSLGDGRGSGYIDYAGLPGLPADMFEPVSRGMGGGLRDPGQFAQWLASRGYRIMEQRTGPQTGFRIVVDQAGNAVNKPVQFDQNDNNFWGAAMAAAAVTGANLGLFPGQTSTLGGTPGAAAPAATTSVSPAIAAQPAASATLPGFGSATVPGATATLNSAGAGAGTAGAAGVAGGSSVGMPALRSAADIASGLYGMSLGRDVARAADPFAPYRGQYADRLAALEANPGLITSTPGWQAGLRAIDRRSAASGYRMSGNEKAALFNYGTDFYSQELQRLASLAGAGATPGAGAVAGANLQGQGLASIGYGLARFFPG